MLHTIVALASYSPYLYVTIPSAAQATDSMFSNKLRVHGTEPVWGERGELASDTPIFDHETRDDSRNSC